MHIIAESSRAPRRSGMYSYSIVLVDRGPTGHVSRYVVWDRIYPDDREDNSPYHHKGDYSSNILLAAQAFIERAEKSGLHPHPEDSYPRTPTTTEA